VSRLHVPQFVTDVFEDPGKRGVLIAGSLSILAVGLVPRVLSPGLPDAQQALKTQLKRRYSATHGSGIDGRLPSMMKPWSSKPSPVHVFLVAAIRPS
jgi:hypothetical protein